MLFGRKVTSECRRMRVPRPVVIYEFSAFKAALMTRVCRGKGEVEMMEYTKLGTTDITMYKLCLGGMSFGQAGTMHDWTLDAQATEKIVQHALDLGINFFDTANAYRKGRVKNTSAKL